MSTPFNTRKQEDIPREGPALPESGRYDFALTQVDTKVSKKGDPQMVWTYTIDRGPNAGHKVKEWHTFSDGNDLSWQRLANICDAAGFTWAEASTLEAFASQFPTDGSFRLSIECEQRFSAPGFTDTPKAWDATERSPVRSQATPYENYINLTEEEYEAWDGEKFANLSPREGFDFHLIYQAAEGKQELQKTSAPEEEEEPALAMQEDDLPFKTRG